MYTNYFSIINLVFPILSLSTMWIMEEFILQQRGVRGERVDKPEEIH